MVLLFNNGNLSLLYMTDAAGNAGFYVVNGTDGSVCPYIRIDNGDNYLIFNDTFGSDFLCTGRSNHAYSGWGQYI